MLRPFMALALLLAGCRHDAAVAVTNQPVEGVVPVAQNLLLDVSLSPDGRQMVVVTVIAGREQLALVNIDGSNLRMLTNTNFDHEDPAWSPDGRSIAFVSKENNGEVISVMNADGSGIRAVSPSDQRAIHPSWTPDGATLLYCTDDDLRPPLKNASDIIAVSLNSGARRVLITGGTNTYPNMSPDGRHIAFRRMGEGRNSEVWLANADGANPHNLSNNPAFDGWPSWSPDSRRLAFASDRAGNQQVYVMDLHGSNVTRVANTEHEGIAPKWSVDGLSIYFSLCRPERCDIYRAPAPR